jgi:hypothetical protein
MHALDYWSDAGLNHNFRTPGISLFTAQCQAADKPIMQEPRIVVPSAPAVRK